MRRFAPVLLAVLASFCVTLASSSPAQAAWIKDGVLLSALPETQSVNGAAPDGAGGMVIVWQDQSPGTGNYRTKRNGPRRDDAARFSFGR